MAKSDTPELVSLDSAQLEELLTKVAGILPPETYQLIEKLLRTLQWLMGLIQAKQTTIGRLQRLIFGAKTEKTSQLYPQPSAGTPTPGSTAAAAPPAPKCKGHGRTAAAGYTGAKRVRVSHPQLRSGDVCPACKQGKIYVCKTLGQLVRISAQPVFVATRYELEKLRCNLCGQVFTAPAPAQAGTSKYDPQVGIMLGYLRFGGGLPHYRMEKIQADFGVRLPASTQWELMNEASVAVEPVYEALVTLAAQGNLIHNDDTTMRVQALNRQDELAAGPQDQRTGIFTTGLVSEVDNHTVALFVTGHQHAGENLDQLLSRRVAGVPPPIQMCDALSRNPAKEYESILANCLAHGRRQFVDIATNFPKECQHVLENLGEVYKHDAQARELDLSPEARLLHHQQHSQKIMNELRQWMEEQLDQKRVEPNSGLGDAIDYMLKHWEPLTLFLRRAGAPLDNNICERALKMAILHRKNSLSYKTLNGARLGDMFMSLIQTCRLCAVNPFDYLTQLQRHAKAVLEHPLQWLPWNHTQALPQSDTI